MPKIDEKLEAKGKQFSEDINDIIVSIGKLRKSIHTKSNFDRKMHRDIDEIVTKLRSLQYLIGEIIYLDIHTIHVTTLMAMELQFTDRKHLTRDEEVSASLLKMGEYAEAFYYAACRIIKSFEKLGLAFKAPGIEAVRDFLYNHPEVMSRSIGSGMSGGGPIMKSEIVERHNTQRKDRFKDKGLYLNFDEFIQALKRVLKARGF